MKRTIETINTRVSRIAYLLEMQAQLALIGSKSAVREHCLNLGRLDT